MDSLKSRLRAIFYPPGTNPLNWKLLFIIFFALVGPVLLLSFTKLYEAHKWPARNRDL